MMGCSKDLDFLRRRNLRYFNPDFSGGNRVAKYVMDGQSPFAKHVTYYVRDASGNVMAVYEHDLETPESYHLAERHIYGSSRVGMITEKVEYEYVYGNQPSEALIGTLSFEETVNFELEYNIGEKQYELSNHLGNVLAVISDWKVPVISGASVVSYTSIVISSQDYSPFGVTLSGRSWSVGYRYGFNGQEKDEEMGREIVSFTFRIYSAQLGRFLSCDPIGRNYPHNSYYAFAENRVIQCKDLEGLEKYSVTGRSFIPTKVLDNPWFTLNFTAHSFAGDDRMSYELNTQAFRTEQKVHVDFECKEVSCSNNTASPTKALDKNGKVIDTSEAAAAGPIPTYNKSFLENGTSITIHLSIDAPNRLVPGAPAINYQLEVTITPNSDYTSFEYEIKGDVDGFPAYELWITDETTGNSYLLFNRTPTETGETPRALFPPMEHSIYKTGNSQCETPQTSEPFSVMKNSPKVTIDPCNQI